MIPRLKLFLSTATVDGAFGVGKWRLLKAIQEHGSLRQAALTLGRSYRKAWGDLNRAEQGLGRKLVEKSRGGHKRGSTALTKFAVDLLDAWENYQTAMGEIMQRSYTTHLQPILGPAQTEPHKQRRRERS